VAKWVLQFPSTQHPHPLLLGGAPPGAFPLLYHSCSHGCSPPPETGQPSPPPSPTGIYNAVLRSDLGAGGTAPRAALEPWSGRFFALSPRISLDLRVFPSISPYLPAFARICPRICPVSLPVSLPVSRPVFPRNFPPVSLSPRISYLPVYLPVSPSIPQYPAVSRGIPPYLAADTVKKISSRPERRGIARGTATGHRAYKMRLGAGGPSHWGLTDHRSLGTWTWSWSLHMHTPICTCVSL